MTVENHCHRIIPLDPKLFFEPGFNVIDGTTIKVKDECVMFVKNETVALAQKKIKITRSKKITEGFGYFRSVRYS